MVVGVVVGVVVVGVVVTVDVGVVVVPVVVGAGVIVVVGDVVGVVVPLVVTVVVADVVGVVERHIGRTSPSAAAATWADVLPNTESAEVAALLASYISSRRYVPGVRKKKVCDDVRSSRHASRGPPPTSLSAS